MELFLNLLFMEFYAVPLFTDAECRIDNPIEKWQVSDEEIKMTEDGDKKM